MKEKETVVVYSDWWKRAEELPDERRLAYYDAIMRYAFTGKAPENELTEADTAIIRKMIDRNDAEYQEVRAKRKAAVKARWEKYKRIQNIQMYTSDTNAGNVNVNVNENGSSSEISLKDISSTTTTNKDAQGAVADVVGEKEFLKSFLANDRLIEALSQEISLQPHSLKATAENIAAQWAATNVTHSGAGGFATHMVNTLRKKQGSPPMQTEPMEERVRRFKVEIRAAAKKLETPPDVANDFYYYWSESDGERMKFELERTWSTERKLRRWMERSG